MTKADTDLVAFLVIIIFLSSLWSHKTGLIQVEHFAGIIIGVVAISAFIVAIFRLVKRIRSKREFPPLEIATMDGVEFEHYVAQILKKRGFSNVRLTEEYDYGIDIIAQKDGITWGIQVKRYSGLVGANAVRQVVAALKIYNCDKAMVITNSTFSHTALKLADANDCVMIDGLKLLI